MFGSRGLDVTSPHSPLVLEFPLPLPFQGASFRVSLDEWFDLPPVTEPESTSLWPVSLNRLFLDACCM